MKKYTSYAADPNMRILKALDIAMRHGGHDGAHHKQWVIDQIVRALTGCPMVPHHFEERIPCDFSSTDDSKEYREFVADAKRGEAGPDTYEWDKGIAP